MADHDKPVELLYGTYRGVCTVCGQTVEEVQPVILSLGRRHQTPCRRCAHQAALAGYDLSAGVEARLLALVDVALVEGTTSTHTN